MTTEGTETAFADTDGVGDGGLPRFSNDHPVAADGQLVYAEESYAIRGAIFEVYKTLGNGYLEEVYQKALEEELRLRAIPFAAQRPLRVVYKGRHCGDYVPDLICYDKIIVELKAVEALHERHKAQVMNYLKATGFRLGLLVNFGAYPKAAILRIAN